MTAQSDRDFRAREIAAAAAQQVGATLDPDALDRLAALVAQGLADAEVLFAVALPPDDPPAADRPQDALP